MNVLKCVYWKLGNSTWEGISCNRIRFNNLQHEVVSIEQFKEQFLFFSLLLLPKIQKCGGKKLLKIMEALLFEKIVEQSMYSACLPETSALCACCSACELA